jgi:hypothetical protein
VALLAATVVLVLPSCTPYPRLPVPIEVPAASPVRVIDVRPPRVLIAGDSLADQHGSHAAVALREAGIDVHVAAWWGWGMLTRDQYDMGATVPLDQQPGGTMMRQVVRAVDEFDPDVVALYSNHNYWPPYPRDAGGAQIGIGTPAFTAMVQTQLTVLVERITANGATVYLVKPAPEQGRTAADNAIWNAYAALQGELGFGIINAGDVVADPTTHGFTDRLSDCAGHAAAVRPDDHLHLTYLGAGLMGTATARSIANTLGISLWGSSAPTDAPAAMLPAEDGYRLVSCDGATFGFGSFSATLGGAALGGGRADGDPVVAATTTGVPGPPTDGADVNPTPGAWLVTAAGHVVSLGDTGGWGDATGLTGAPGRRAVGIASTGTGNGYWIAVDDGTVQPIGDAPDFGGLGLAGGGEHVVAMASTPDHAGYWLVTSTGRVGAFGSAQAWGDLSAAPPPDPVVAIAPHPGGEGYWILDASGAVHPFGAAADHGSAAHQGLLRVVAWNFPRLETQVVPASEAPTTAVAMLPTPSGDGYWIWLANGAVCHFGDAAVLGGLHRAHINFSMRLLGVPFYGPGDCSQSSESVQSELGQITDPESQDIPLREADAAPLP